MNKGGVRDRVGIPVAVRRRLSAGRRGVDLVDDRPRVGRDTLVGWDENTLPNETVDADGNVNPSHRGFGSLPQYTQPLGVS